MLKEYGIVSLLLIVLGTAMLRLIIRRDYLTKGRLTKISAAIEFLIFFLLNLVAYLHMPRDWPSVHVNGMLRVVGGLLVLVGIIVATRSMISLGSPESLGQKNPCLRETGPYRVTRNPQLLGYGVFIIGAGVLWPSWYTPFWILQTVVVVHAMVLIEEEYLLSHYGSRYAAYCRRVPRYLGKIKAN
jgi:protein-S-isoprenylcysteine O-methyltransferase Ste14